MQNIEVNKVELLAKLRENREKHATEYEAAVDEYRKRVIEQMSKRLKQIRAGGEIELHFDLIKPVNYLNSYDRAIQMLEWDTDDEVKLSEKDFDRYVLNNWEWTHVFAQSTQVYNA